ncbi:hypothetical protein [Sphingobacterium sp. MYb382]|uniref:hypothetical protein n=1 Tax=Sphingobacterium sp. MYb382 TaxID=2745278 RepID=UPI0030AA98B1
MPRFFTYFVYMLWSIDGFDVEILLQQEEGVRVLQWDATARVVAVQATLPKEEAIWCIRKLSADAVFVEQEIRMDRFDIFDRSWPLKISSHRIKPYFNNHILHAYVADKGLSAVQRDRLIQEILQERLLVMVGNWEERLSCLIPNVAFRKLKTNPYSICLKKKLITFDKNLHRLKMEVLDYGVFLAISTYENLSEKTLLSLRERHFPLYKNYDKVLAYEYGLGDSDKTRYT